MVSGLNPYSTRTQTRLLAHTKLRYVVVSFAFHTQLSERATTTNLAMDDSDDDGYSANMVAVTNSMNEVSLDREEALEAAKRDTDNFAAWRAEMTCRQHNMMLERILIIARLYVSVSDRNNTEEGSSEC